MMYGKMNLPKMNVLQPPECLEHPINNLPSLSVNDSKANGATLIIQREQDGQALQRQHHLPEIQSD